MPWSSRALGRFLSVWMVLWWTVSCGRVGYDLRGVMTDRESADAAPDVVPTDGRGPAADATLRDAAPIPPDAPLAEGAPDDGPAPPVRDAAPDRVDGSVDAPVPDGPARDGSVDATDAASSEGGSDSSTVPCGFVDLHLDRCAP